MLEFYFKLQKYYHTDTQTLTQILDIDFRSNDIYISTKNTIMKNVLPTYIFKQQLSNFPESKKPLKTQEDTDVALEYNHNESQYAVSLAPYHL